MQKPLPSLPLPGPILCSDPGSFAENTLLVRLPDIARRILTENQFPAQTNWRIEALIADLPNGRVRDLDDPGAPDIELWKSYLRPYTGLVWRQLPFLVCENIFYRRVLEATGYFQKGATFRTDPYTYQKKMGLETSQQSVHGLAARLAAWHNTDFPLQQAVSEAVENTLWSNRADLSLWPADAAGTPSNSQLHQAAEFLLVDDLAEMVKTILSFQGGAAAGRVDFLIDNAGFELVCDLAFADLLLSRDLAEHIHFHLKAHPTFVSDALSADVQMTVDFLLHQGDEKTTGFGERIAGAIGTGKLSLKEGPFWNSPLRGWELPDALRDDISRAALVISKGDANYRRLVGDLLWPETSPFSSVMDYFPTRLAALRTLKSEVVVGLKEGQASALDLKEPAWRTNGRWGLVQLS
jgi:uncharacterized protein with ATP-grasp and redox domains